MRKEKLMRISRTLLSVGALFFLASAGAGALVPQQQQAPARTNTRSEDNIKREVRHELMLLPWYSVFDNLAYSVNGYNVTLLGQVTRPALKDDAEAAVKKIEGVENVDDQIEVLPVSPNDDQIRRAEFRAIYSQPSLQRYAEGTVQQIHIIVKNGHVTLEGFVASQADKDVANVSANGVSGVFSVTNNLQVASGSKS
jgi:hyperosmotically inducible periplasmic protein